MPLSTPRHPQLVGLQIVIRTRVYPTVLRLVGVVSWRWRIQVGGSCEFALAHVPEQVGVIIPLCLLFHLVWLSVLVTDQDR